MSMLRDLREEREVRHERAAEARADLRLVTPDEGARGRRVTRLLTVLVAVAACAVLFGTVCTHVLLTQGQAELDSLDTRAANAEATHQQLQVQVAELGSPARIVPAARERLKMIPPPTVVYLTPDAPRVPVPTTTTPTATATDPSTTVAGKASPKANASLKAKASASAPAHP
jgi:cell division protein FtsL